MGIEIVKKIGWGVSNNLQIPITFFPSWDLPCWEEREKNQVNFLSQTILILRNKTTHYMSFEKLEISFNFSNHGSLESDRNLHTCVQMA